MASDVQQAYESLCEHMRQLGVLDSIGQLLEWDELTKMPPGGVEHRAEQATLIARLVHQRMTDPAVGEWLETLFTSSRAADSQEDAEVTVARLQRLYNRQRKMPPALVEELSRTAVLAQAAWAEARTKDDYPAFRPWLEKMYQLKRQQAEALGYETSPYDPLLDEYEPGIRADEVAAVLAELRDALVPLLHEITAAGPGPDDSVLRRHYPTDRQEAFVVAAARRIGFDFGRGRLDVTTHPFCCTVGPRDVRITTRYNENHFSQAFFGVLHEAGHGLYEQGLPPEQFGLPLGQAVSLGLHESQSRLWENLVGRSFAFWKYLYPQAVETFPESLGDISLETFYHAINRSEPSLIRVEADELTYNLHILVRFEIEQELLGGSLSVDDAPEAWNAKYEAYVGVAPANDREGILQDTHWSQGLVGYFPTYALGNLFAAQLFAAADRDLGGIASMLGDGETRPLLEWLREHVHRHGQRHWSRELVERATGVPLSTVPFIDSLRDKLLPIYNL